MFPILSAGTAEVSGSPLPAFLVARDGLYLRKRSLLGLSQTKVEGVTHLPAESEYLDYALPRIPSDLMARVVGFFRTVYRLHQTEALVLLLWAGEGFDLFVPNQKVSPASVSHVLDEAELPSGGRVVGSIHSHGAFGAWASSIDEDDEATFDGLHLVVGGFDRRRPNYSAAIAVDGHRFGVRHNIVFERPRRLIEPPEDWLRRVKLLPPPRPSKTKSAGLGSNGAAAPIPGRAIGRKSRVDLDVALVRADRLAGDLGLRLSYWLVPVFGSSRKGSESDD
jgi:proteasome lid subunit RPN8/RPN11